MTARVNGYVIDDKLGFLMGENAFVSVATNDKSIRINTTGVVTPIEQFKKLYAIDPSHDIYAEVDNPVPEISIDPVTGAVVSRIVKVRNVSLEHRKINGVEYMDDSQYMRAWCAQENLKRIVDTVQQRSPIIAMSKASTEDFSLTKGSTPLKYGEWSETATADPDPNVDDVSVVTFLVERGHAFNAARPNAAGQPDEILIGQELLDDLSKLDLVFEKTHDRKATIFSERLSPVPYIEADGSPSTATILVRIDNVVPQLI